MTANVLLGTALVAYFLGAVVFLANLFLKHPRLGSVGMGISLVGALSHTASIILRAVQTHRPPFATPAEAWSFLAWAIVVIYLSISLKKRLSALGAFALPAALLSISLGAVTAVPGYPSLLPGVNAWGLALHVPASILSLGAFAIAFGCAVCYLIQDRLLREKRFTGVVRVLPPLNALDTTSYWLIVFGFCLLTAGIVTGAILAHDAWTTSWVHHSKAYMTLLLWMTYAGYLYVRGVARWRGRWTHTAVVVAVVILLLLYGVAALLLDPASTAAGAPAGPLTSQLHLVARGRHA